MSLSVMTNTESYSTLIRDFFNFDNYIIKFSVILAHRCTDVNDDLSNLYSLCWFTFIL